MEMGYYEREFDKFYREYLGLDGGMEVDSCLLCRSEHRNEPLNKRYYYRVIVTDYNGKRVVSCPPELKGEKLKKLCAAAGNDLEEVGKTLQVPNGYSGGYMYRMVRDGKETLKNGGQSFDGAEKQIAFHYLPEMKKYLAVSGEDLAGYCKISDVYGEYGNMVVWVGEKYRRQGIAAELAARTILQCRQDGIIPMYVVRENNAPSIALAKKLGFHVVQREYVISEERDLV